jgi:copper chaperone CopZ
MKIFRFQKTIFSLTAAVFFALALIAGCGKTNNQTTDKPKDDKQVTMTKDEKKETTQSTDVKVNNSGDVTEVKLPTIQCNTCKKNITKALKKVDGIEDFKIDVEGKTANVKFDKSKTDLAKIEGAITAAGYDANDKKADPKAYEELDDCCKLPKDRKEK